MIEGPYVETNTLNKSTEVVGFDSRDVKLASLKKFQDLSRKSLKDSICYQSEVNFCPASERSQSSCSLSSFDSDHTDDEASAVSSVHPEDIDPLERLIRVAGKQVHELFESSDPRVSMARFMHSRIQSGAERGSFLVTNLAALVSQYEQWQAELPMVHPFYAVKCNPDPVIVRVLASLGCGFDCATMGEIDLVLNGLGEELSFRQRGLAASSIVYANPAKMEHMIEFAVENNVRMTVFDGEDELHKIAGLKCSHSNLQLLLRLTTDDKASLCRFSKKFGCPVADSSHLLKVAQSLGLNVAGVSFHVGSGCGDAGAYATALDDARQVFEEAARLGMAPLHIVDLGGGFPGGVNGTAAPGMPSFQELSATIRTGIVSFCAALGRPLDSMRFIAEPGRYFVTSCTSIASKVYSRKGGSNAFQALYLDDGVYGSFNNVVYDHVVLEPYKLSELVTTESQAAAARELIPTAVFGPTCDGLDQLCSLDSTVFPRCSVGDWLMFENHGAYTHTASFVFNGYTHFPNKLYCYM